MNDTWPGDLAEARDLPQVQRTPSACAWITTVGALGDLTEAARQLDRHSGDGAAHQLEQLRGADVIHLVVQLQDVRRQLAQTEALLVRQVGLEETAPREGVLADGRPYQVRRGASRKSWAHDEWKRDVRDVLVEKHGATSAVSDSTGEVIDVFALLAEVQAAQTSGPPRVTALKQLGLDPDDYCETVPGTWGVQVTTED